MYRSTSSIIEGRTCNTVADGLATTLIFIALISLLGILLLGHVPDGSSPKCWFGSHLNSFLWWSTTMYRSTSFIIEGRTCNTVADGLAPTRIFIALISLLGILLLFSPGQSQLWVQGKQEWRTRIREHGC